MSQNEPYDPSRPPSGVPDPTVHGPNPEPTIDDFERERQAYREEQAAPQTVSAHARPEARTDRGGAWIWGVFLILLGGLFLLENAGLFNLENWWALFILLPAVGSFRSAYAAYRSTGGRLTGSVRGPFLGGILLSAVALIFLFGLDFGELWPLLLVFGGVVLLANALMPD